MFRKFHLVDISYISEFTNNPDLDKKTATLATKAELKTEQDKTVNFKHLIQVISMIKVFLKRLEHRMI